MKVQRTPKQDENLLRVCGTLSLGIASLISVEKLWKLGRESVVIWVGVNGIHWRGSRPELIGLTLLLYLSRSFDHPKLTCSSPMSHFGIKQSAGHLFTVASVISYSAVLTSDNSIWNILGNTNWKRYGRLWYGFSVSQSSKVFKCSALFESEQEWN